MDKMAGYSGYSKSNNAVDAESEGRFPLSKAVPIFANLTGISRHEAKHLLTALGTSEWHHTSKLYNPVNYYDTTRAFRVWLMSKALGMPMSDSFIATVKACGLDSEENPVDKLHNPADEYDYNLEQFRQAVETGEWL